MAEHDQLFKRAFRVPEHAAGELRAVLPKELVEAIDFQSLELVQSDVVGAQLDERFSDAPFRASFRRVPGYIWLLLEHQSEPDRFMVPFALAAFERELDAYACWYNGHRVHAALDARSPAEVRDGVKPRKLRPALEPRARFPRARAGPGSKKRRRLRGRLDLSVTYFRKRKHLPIVELRRAP